MANIDPVVRHMLLGDDVTTDPANPRKIVVNGLIHVARLAQPVRLPAVIDQLCVLLLLAGGRGVGDAQIVGVEADTDQPVFRSAVFQITYPPDPLEIVTRLFRLQQCVVPRAGLYWIQFWHNGRLLAEQPLTVR